MGKTEILEALYNGKNFGDCISKMEPAHLRDDLRQEVILAICELPDEKIVKLHAENVLEFYVVRVIINMVRSKVSPFAKKYRTAHAELTSNEVAEESGIDDRMIREELEDYTLSEIDGLYWYDSEMVRLYMKLGTFRAIQKHTGIPHVSCYKTIQKALVVLRKKAKAGPAKPLFSKAELRFIQNNESL